jgi:hypothetical protein
MLAYILSIVIAIFSLILFGLAFFAPSLHRRDDFLWSGVGLFYALVLWLCAGQMTGAILLGQSAATALLLALGWQTLHFRDAIAHPEKGIDLSFSVIASIQNRLGATSNPQVKKPASTVISTNPEETSLSETLSSVKEGVEEKVSEAASFVEEKVSSFVEQNQLDETVSQIKTGIQDVVEDVKAATSEKEGFSVKKLLNFGKNTEKSPPDPPKNVLNEIADFEIEVEPPRVMEPEPVEPEVKVDRFVPSDWVEATEDNDLEVLPDDELRPD